MKVVVVVEAKQQPQKFSLQALVFVDSFQTKHSHSPSSYVRASRSPSSMIKCCFTTLTTRFLPMFTDLANTRISPFPDGFSHSANQQECHHRCFK